MHQAQWRRIRPAQKSGTSFSSAAEYFLAPAATPKFSITKAAGQIIPKSLSMLKVDELTQLFQCEPCKWGRCLKDTPDAQSYAVCVLAICKECEANGLMVFFVGLACLLGRIRKWWYEPPDYTMVQGPWFLHLSGGFQPFLQFVGAFVI